MDYSAVYIVIKTDAKESVVGHGLTFTLGRGNDIGKCGMHFLKFRCISC